MNVAQSRGVAVDYDPFSGSESALAYDSTEAQREIWINSQISEEASCAYNESISLRLEGRLYEDLLASSLEKMIARHEALRSTFSEDGSGVTVLTSLEHPLLILDTGLEEYLAWDSSTAFNLRDGPLFRCALLHRDHKLHELVLTVHGIVCDARSLAVILEDLGELYTAGIEGRLPDLGDREDFSLFAGRDRDLRQSARYRDDADYWRMAFASLPPDLDLPADRRRPSLRSTSARRARIACRPGSQARLREIASENAVSMTELLLAAFSAFLSKLTGKTDLVVATPIAGSSAHLMRASVGQCANLLPLRSSIEPGATFLDLLALVKRSMSDAVEHSAYSYGAILDELRMARDPSRMPLLSTAFSHTRRLPADALRFGELSAAYSFNPRSSEIFEIRVDAVEGPESLELLMHCSEALFTAETMDRRVREFETLLADICLRPEAAIDDLSMLSAQEEELVLRGWNDTARSYPNVELLNRIYEQRAALMPEAVAISDSTRSFTHGEFNGQVERLRRSLVSLGTGPGDRVGVHMRRSIDMVVALYGITAAGAAYVPLDPDYPVLRLKAIIDDAGISTVCTHSSLPGLGIPVKNLLCVDELADQPGDAQASAAASASPEDTAYIIYTSGSTGSPKGVEISHRSIANRLYWMQEAFAVTGKDRVLQKTPFTFDVSVWEFFWPMLFGSTLVVAPPDIHRDARALVDFIKEQGITIVHFVPSMFEAFLEEPTVRECASIRTIICSGEALPVALCRRCAAALPDARVFNLYGPTEAAVDVSWHEFSSDESYSTETVPIGVPVANTKLYILDEKLRPKVPGSIGELYIAGVQVGKGYVNKPDLTAKAFVHDPFDGKPGARMYRTGDLARWRYDGVIEYLGRNDHQVKIRGNRVEIGEIEAVLLAHKGVQNAAILAKRDESGENKLHAYIVARGDGSLDAAAIQEYLASVLPAAMIPSGFLFLEALPLTTSGKTDRKALLALATQSIISKMDAATPENAFQRQILDIWINLLGSDSFGIDHNFFDIGGNSLKAIRVVRKMGIMLDKIFPVAVLFQFPTVRKLAGYLQDGESEDGGSIAERAQKQRASMQQDWNIRAPGS